MSKYDYKKIERKWRKEWEKAKTYKNYKKGKKFYILDMFPYPSGEGLHVGHPRGYIATDVVARFKQMKGFGVLHPMGWDSFGLPAENYALAHKIHPKIAVSKNIKRFKEQLEQFGFTYDWDREVTTSDPEYYKWTQWIFLKLFENGLVYSSHEPIIWCPSCKTGLALEDLEDGKCERCGSEVEKKSLRQWVLKMTDYAEKLLRDLSLLDWPESIKEQQKNWIGKSEGASIEFPIFHSKLSLEVFTTRLDTIFGCTYCVIAPEHGIISNLKPQITNFSEVEKYVEAARKKTDLARTDLAKEKTGVELKGVKAINPFNKKMVPLFVADYVLGSYGSGAVMAVPAHDERDFEFAKKFGLEIKPVIFPEGREKQIAAEKMKSEKAFTEDGVLFDSNAFSGLKSAAARQAMAAWLAKENLGGPKINYKMRDWVFARQRYWGEPFPLIFCENCKKEIEVIGENPRVNPRKSALKFSKGELTNPGWIQVPEKNLPVKLPEVKSYEPSGTGESPLVNIRSWVETKCPKCGGKGERETNTMPQWAGSNWYYLAYLMKRGKKYAWDKKEIKKWMPVDLYVGGVEHATRHLLYARFWHKFLHDIGEVGAPEPFKKLMNQGLILAEDGRKMSKRWKNVVNPDEIIAHFGADSIRLYESFMGPFNQQIAWSSDGLRGMKRFLDRVWLLKTKIGNEKVKVGSDSKIRRKKMEVLINQTVKKVSEDIEGFRFNTAVSALMILANELEKEESVQPKHYLALIQLLAPFAPHLSEEIWQELRPKKTKKFSSIFNEPWPKYNPKLVDFDEVELVVQINGKLRDSFSIRKGVSQKEAEDLAFKRDKIKALVAGQKVQKIIFVPDRVINIVV